MNTSNNVGASTPGSAAGLAAIKNPKSVVVSEAVNGFIVTAQRADSYGADAHIAKDAREVLDIITGYFGIDE